MIPYDLQKIKVLVFDVDGVLSGNNILLCENPSQNYRTSNIKDGYAIQLAVKCGFHVVIITGGESRAVENRYRQLGVEHIYMGAKQKEQLLKGWCVEHGRSREEVMYMGDDMPDWAAMKYSGCPVCPNDACKDILGISLYVSPQKGGEGCVRDVIEQVLRANKCWYQDTHRVESI